MRKYLLASTCLVAAVAAPANAEKWYLIGTGDNDAYYADADSVTRSGNVVQFNAFNGVGTAITGYARSIYYFKAAMQFDCQSKLYRDVSRVGYDGQFAVVGDMQVETTWQPITAGTFGEGLLGFGCDASSWRETPVSDPFADAEEYWYYYYEY